MLLFAMLCVQVSAQTSTFTYTASHRLDRFDEYSYFVGADSVVSHDFDEATLTGTVVYAGEVTEVGKLALMFNSDLTSIVIPEGVTKIGFHAFYACMKLTNITLPKSLTTIDGLAFDSCSGLANGKFIVDDLAWWCGINFADCYSNPLFYAKHFYANDTTEITGLDIPEGVTNIPDNAFYHCEGITSVNFPSTLESIGSNAFNSTGLTSVVIPEGFTTINESAFYHCANLAAVIIPEGVTTIRGNAFAYSGLRELTLPSTIRSMSQSFYKCDSLVSLTLTEGITTIGSSFYSCTSLKEVHIPSSIKRLEGNDFSSCSSLETVTIAEGVEAINGFSDCSKLSSINIPSTATTISGFRNCESLKSIYIPKNVVDVTGFNGCSALEKVIIEDLESWCKILFSSYASYNPQCNAKHLYLGTPDKNEEITELVIPEGITQLKRYAFGGLASITSVTLPSSFTSLDNTTFYDCSGVENVYATCNPNKLSWGGNGFKAEKATMMHVTDIEAWRAKFLDANVTFVGDLTQFRYAATEKSAKFDEYNNFTGASAVVAHELNFETGEGLVTYLGNVTAIGENALSGCAVITAITVPEGVTAIDSHAFGGCTALTTVTLPSTIELIADGAFEGSNIVADIYCTANPDSFTWDGNDSAAQFKPEKATLFHVADAAPWVERFPDANVTFMGNMTTFSYTAAKKIDVFEKIENFEGAIALASHIYDPATGEGKAIFSGEVTGLKSSTFAYNTALQTIIVPPTVTSLGSYVFSHIKTLTAVNLPNTITNMLFDVFYDDESLTTVNIPTSITELPSYTFGKCPSLTEITIPDNITKIGSDAFYNCTGLVQIVIPDNVTRIEEYAFSNCTGLTAINIPESVKNIGYRCFYNSPNLVKVIVPDLKAWCGISFYDKESNPLYYAHHLYSDEETEITEVVVPEGTKLINQHVFFNGSFLKSVSIPLTVTSVGGSAFEGCEALTELVLPDSVATINYRTFYGSGITTLTLPAQLTKIDYSAFAGMAEVSDVYCAADPAKLYWFGSDNAEAFKPEKATLFHVEDKLPWIMKFPNANVTFYDGFPLYGDVNGDGLISGADVTSLYSVLLDGTEVAGDADVNRDGVVSGADVTALYSILLGN
ncbi:MAG: leucine-rich repeat protein [Muribaculaceae bacterium]|nr:leucine-rich repeat protein [Muribaculaceae bacterium]